MKSILVIEDNPVNMTLIKEIIELMGYQTHEAYRGLDALQLLEAGIPDLIISDIQLPDIDGISLIRQIKQNERWSSIPIIVLSADSRIMELAERAGATDYMMKPFNIKEFMGKINAYLL